MSETEVILGNVPSKSNCYRIITFKKKGGESGHASLAKTKELKQYEEGFAFQCRKYRNAGIDVEFKFILNVFYPSKRADLDNSLKVILDCLQKVGAIKNDNKCVRIYANRYVDTSNPRIEFSIEPMES